MAQKKENDKDVKVKDLAPKKDAKGGASLDRGASAEGRIGMNRGQQMNAGGQNLDAGRSKLS